MILPIGRVPNGRTRKMFGFGNARRLRRMANRVRRMNRQAYAIAAGFYPRAFTSGRIQTDNVYRSPFTGEVSITPVASGAGNVYVRSADETVTYYRGNGISRAFCLRSDRNPYRNHRMYRAKGLPNRMADYRLSTLRPNLLMGV